MDEAVAHELHAHRLAKATLFKSDPKPFNSNQTILMFLLEPSALCFRPTGTPGRAWHYLTLALEPTSARRLNGDAGLVLSRAMDYREDWRAGGLWLVSQGLSSPRCLSCTFQAAVSLCGQQLRQLLSRYGRLCPQPRAQNSRGHLLSHRGLGPPVGIMTPNIPTMTQRTFRPSGHTKGRTSSWNSDYFALKTLAFKALVSQ